MFYSGGFIYNPNTQKVLLHQRDGNTDNNPNLWAFFGGLSEGEELPEEAFKREILEELGFKVDKEVRLRDYFNPDFDTHRYVFYVESDEFDFELTEGADAKWFSIDEALKLNLSKRTREDLIYASSKLNRRG